MEDFESLYQRRRSVRQFANRKISDTDLERIVRAGQAAPSARNQQPLHIYLIQGEEAKRRLQSCYDRDWFAEADAYLLVTGKPKEAWSFTDGRATSPHIDTSIAVTHMMLEATNLGIGSTWVCAFDRLRCCELFGFDFETEEPVSILALGYPLGDPLELPHKRKSLEELVTRL